MSSAILVATLVSVYPAVDTPSRRSDIGCAHRVSVLSDLADFPSWEEAADQMGPSEWLSSYTSHVARVDSPLLTVASACGPETRRSALEVRGRMYRDLAHAMLTVPAPDGTPRKALKQYRKTTGESVCSVIEKAWDADAELGVPSPDRSAFGQCRKAAWGGRR